MGSTVYEVVGDVMGDDVEGDVLGEYDEVGAGPQPRGGWRHARGMQMRSGPPPNQQRVLIAKKPNWRDGQAAPGVMLPDEGMVPLGMVPDDGTGTFLSTGPTKITWIGRLQKPYRAERLLVSTVRDGTTATGRLLGQFFVGVDLNMATIQGVDIELFGNPTAFGTRMTLLQAPPGVEIQVPVTPSALPAASDSIFASISWAGRIIH